VVALLTLVPEFPPAPVLPEVPLPTPVVAVPTTVTPVEELDVADALEALVPVELVPVELVPVELVPVELVPDVLPLVPVVSGPLPGSIGWSSPSGVLAPQPHASPPHKMASA
jgi:hypothetical protein